MPGRCTEGPAGWWLLRWAQEPLPNCPDGATLQTGAKSFVLAFKARVVLGRAAEFPPGAMTRVRWMRAGEKFMAEPDMRFTIRLQPGERPRIEVARIALPG